MTLFQLFFFISLHIEFISKATYKPLSVQKLANFKATEDKRRKYILPLIKHKTGSIEFFQNIKASSGVNVHTY